MQPITIYTTSTCPYCAAAKDLLRQKGGDERRGGDAEIAEDAIHAECAAGLVAGGLHQHRRADRVVDR